MLRLTIPRSLLPGLLITACSLSACATGPGANAGSPQRARLLVERAEIDRLKGDFDAAYANVEAAERLAPGSAEPVVTRALLLFGRGDEAGGSAQLARALTLEPNNVGARYIAMRQSRFTGDIKTCVEHGNHAASIAPDDTSVLSMRARCLAELGRGEDAMADLRKIEAIGPSMAFVLDDMALTYLAVGRPAEAASAARRALEMNPWFEDAHFDLISALMASGAHQEAIAAFQAFRASRLEDRIGVANNLSWELYLAKRYADSLRIAEEWLAANPRPIEEPNHIANANGYSKVLDTAAHARAALGQRQEAVATFLRAAEMSPDKLRPLYLERLTAQGFAPKPRDGSLESALRACVATGDKCRLYMDIPRSGPLTPPL